MEIKPGIGVGQIKFGMDEQELKKIYGQPALIKEGEYVENSGDLNREWVYSNGISFTFDKEDDYRLGIISVTKKGFTLFGRDLIGVPFESVRSFMSKQSYEIPKKEDWSSEESPNHVLLDYDSIGLFLWFNDDILDEIQFSYQFLSDNNTIDWPE
jgi:hypothetical protein